MRTIICAPIGDSMGPRPRAPFFLTPPEPGPGLDAVDEDQFIGWIADRYIATSTEAADYCKEAAEATYKAFLELEGVEFGATGHDWTADGAADLADEDMECWEGDE